LADETGMIVRFGLTGDTHGGSIAQQITNLNHYVDAAYRAGVRHILHAGDVHAGENVYRGQLRDLFAQGADQQVLVADRTLPRRPGLKWYLLGGNHDFSFIKASGFNPVAELARRRDDVTYVGYDMADVPLTDRVDVRLWHPHGGVPYAISYRLQKGIEQMALEELQRAISYQENPRMRIVGSGHLHVRLDGIGRGPITGIQVGCWEGQTNYLKRKALFPQIGGYIIKVYLTWGGLIQQMVPRWIGFVEIENDYRNYPDLLMAVTGSDQVEEIETLFEWQPASPEEWEAELAEGDEGYEPPDQ
jgi:hypothetical protein